MNSYLIKTNTSDPGGAVVVLRIRPRMPTPFLKETIFNLPRFVLLPTSGCPPCPILPKPGDPAATTALSLWEVLSEAEISPATLRPSRMTSRSRGNISEDSWSTIRTFAWSRTCSTPRERISTLCMKCSDK